MSDAETLKVYAEAAQEYVDGFARKDDEIQAQDLAAFVAAVTPNGRVLDLGCGPGHWAARLQKAGFIVDAIDASPEMAALAKSDFGIDVRIADFEDLDARAIYDGIWANFSLLHAPRTDFPAHLGRIHRALKPGGTLHIGMKLGSGEGRDKLGRFYAYYSEGELKGLLQQAGFTVTRSRRGNGKGLAGGEETFIVLTAHA